ncbi:MAG: HD domain-containing protein [Desulfuromonadaceae bacterium]|nr:HD domain-containing protein [Desulfuromonadaceae bacterium]
MTDDIERHQLSAVITSLSHALAAGALYAPEHPRVTAQIPRLADSLVTLLQQRDEVTLLIVKEELLYQGKPLEKSQHTTRIARLCGAKNIGYLRFTSGIDNAEIALLLRVVLGFDALETLQNNAQYIEIGDVDVTQGEVAAESRAIGSFEDLSAEELQNLKSFYQSAREKAPLDTQDMASIIAGFITAFRREANPLLALVPLRMEDEYTFTHSVNVGILNVAQGMSLGFSGQMLHDVGIAGMVHDVGKIFVDNEIIRKPGALSDADWEKMKAHPSRGAQYLMNQEGIPKIAVFSAFEHHMRYDLGGYPEVPKHWRLNVCSQMTMISDTFDALRTRRAYKEPWDFAKISGRMLEVAGTQLNPHLTLNFLKTLAKMGEDVVVEGISLMAGAEDRPESEFTGRCVCE